MDSIDDIKRLDKYPKEKIIRYPCDKDYTDTELALNLLWEKECEEVFIIGGGGGRIEHLFAIRSLFEREKSPDRWFTKNEDIYCLKNGEELTLAVKPKNMISVFPLGEEPWTARSAGLKWNLDGLSWDRGFFGVSNIALKNSFSVFSDKGRFLIIVTEDKEDK